MNDDTKIMPREPGSDGAVDILSPSARVPHFDLSPREPHLYDYLLILRKHQWLILSILLTVVTIVSIATFRMRPVYVATAKIEIDRENSNVLPFQGADPYDLMMEDENYIETQSKILTSETLALQTIRNSGLASHPEFASEKWPFGGHCHRESRQPETPAGSQCLSRQPQRQARSQQQFNGCEFRIY